MIVRELIAFLNQQYIDKNLKVMVDVEGYGLQNIDCDDFYIRGESNEDILVIDA